MTIGVDESRIKLSSPELTVTGMFGVPSEQVACGWNGATTPQTNPQILRPSANSFANVERSGSGEQTRSNCGVMNAQNRSNEHAASSADLNGIANRRFIEGHEGLD
jgi:hypothetical protein